MKLTWEQTRDIAIYLEDKIRYHFHDAIHNTVGYDVEVSDEDILRIKEELKTIL